MQQILIEKYGLQAKTHIVRRVLKLLKVWFEESHEESYGMLLDYIEEIKLRNPGSICSCVVHFYRNFTKDYPGMNLKGTTFNNTYNTKSLQLSITGFVLIFR